MIHIHLIITATLLLLGAFIGLILCFCVDIIPIIKSRGSTLVSRDTVTREQARALKKSLQKNVTLLQSKSENIQQATNLKPYKNELVIIDIEPSNLQQHKSQTTSAVVEQNSYEDFNTSLSHKKEDIEDLAPQTLPILSSSNSSRQRDRQKAIAESPSKQINEDKQKFNERSETEPFLKSNWSSAKLDASKTDLNQLNQTITHNAPAAGRCTCGSSIQPLKPSNIKTRNDQDARVSSNRSWSSMQYHQRRLAQAKTRSTTFFRNSSPYSSASSSTSSSSGSGRRIRVTRLEDIQEDVGMTVEETNKISSDCSTVTVDREMLQYVDTNNSSIS